jgi:hypothetical protein
MTVRPDKLAAISANSIRTVLMEIKVRLAHGMRDGFPTVSRIIDEAEKEWCDRGTRQKLDELAPRRSDR